MRSIQKLQVRATSSKQMRAPLTGLRNSGEYFFLNMATTFSLIEFFSTGEKPAIMFTFEKAGFSIYMKVEY